MVQHHGSDSAGKWACELSRSSTVEPPFCSRVCGGCRSILWCCFRNSTPDGSFGEYPCSDFRLTSLDPLARKSLYERYGQFSVALAYASWQVIGLRDEALGWVILGMSVAGLAFWLAP